MASGIVPVSSVPNWPAPADGIFDAMRAALVAAGFPPQVEHNPDGLLVADVATVESTLANYEGSAFQLQWNKARKMEALADVYKAKFTAGFNYTGPDGIARNFQIDSTSQFNIDVQANSALGCILANETWSAQFYWIAADNSYMPLPTAQDMRAFALAVKNYITALVLTNRAFKDAIGNASDMVTLNAINLSVEWP